MIQWFKYFVLQNPLTNLKSDLKRSFMSKINDIQGSARWQLLHNLTCNNLYKCFREDAFSAIEPPAPPLIIYVSCDQDSVSLQEGQVILRLCCEVIESFDPLHSFSLQKNHTITHLTVFTTLYHVMVQRCLYTLYSMLCFYYSINQLM